MANIITGKTIFIVFIEKKINPGNTPYFNWIKDSGF